MAVSREEEVRQLAVRALRARLSGDVPTLEEIASRWLAYRVRAMMDDAAHTNPGERWHWANEPDHDAIWTAVRVWNGLLLEGAAVTFQDYPDGTQHAYVPFAADEEATYVVVCQAEEGIWRYHDTTRTFQDSLGAAERSITATRRPASAQLPLAAPEEDDYWGQYDALFPGAASGGTSSTSTANTSPTSGVRQPKPLRASSALGRRGSVPTARAAPSFSLQREKQLRDGIRQAVKGLYALATINGLSAGEFISLVKDSCEL